MTQEQRDDASYEAIMIVNELHKTIDYSVYCRLIDLIDMLGLPDETCTAEYPKPAQHEQVSPTTQSCPEKRTQNATMDPNGDEQREQLRAIWTLGGRWLAKDADGVVNYYIKMPYKENGYWYEPDNDEKYGYAIPLSVGVCELRELNKADEPLDIGKALGVEG